MNEENRTAGRLLRDVRTETDDLAILAKYLQPAAVPALLADLRALYTKHYQIYWKPIEAALTDDERAELAELAE